MFATQLGQHVREQQDLLLRSTEALIQTELFEVHLALKGLAATIATRQPDPVRVFHHYIETAGLVTDKPAYDTVMFAPKIEGPDIHRFIAEIDADPTRRILGYPDLAARDDAHDTGHQDIHFPVVEYAPILGRDRLSGADFWHEDGFRTALSKAIDTGQFVLGAPNAGRFLFGDPVGEGIHSTPSTIFAFLPIYDPTQPLASEILRRKATVGVVSLRLDMGAFVQDVLTALGTSADALSLLDAGSTRALRSDGVLSLQALFGIPPPGRLSELQSLEDIEKARLFEAGGRHWVLMVNQDQRSVTQSALWTNLPLLALLSMMFLGLALAVRLYQRALVRPLDSDRHGLRGLTNVVDTPMALLHKDLERFWVNHAWWDQLAVQPLDGASVEGDDFLTSRVPIEARTVIREGLDRCFGSEQSQPQHQPQSREGAPPMSSQDCRLAGKNGESHWVTFIFVALAPDRAGILVQRSDQSQKAQSLEEGGARQEQMALVERLVARRTRELQAARNRAEAANQAKTNFLANMSHELRTPLNAVIGFADVILSELFGPLGNERYRDYLQDIHKSGTHLLALISDMLDLAKIEAGKLEISEESVDLSFVSSTVISMVSERARQAGVSIQSMVGKDVSRLRCDGLRIKQCLLNLLTNAIKFSDPGSVVLLDIVVVKDDCLEIRVKDQGSGMTEAQCERAMRPFEQISGSPYIAEEAAGTGLGLPISLKLMELHQGTLELYSQVGQGTLAVMRFPFGRVLPPRGGGVGFSETSGVGEHGEAGPKEKG
ncbi:MAG: ATP-binding protein [Rhodospirillaceae bacterium]